MLSRALVGKLFFFLLLLNGNKIELSVNQRHVGAFIKAVVSIYVIYYMKLQDWFLNKLYKLNLQSYTRGRSTFGPILSKIRSHL